MLTPPENKVEIDHRPVREGACEWCLSPGPVSLRRAIVNGRVYDVCAGCVVFLESRAGSPMETKGS